MEALNEALLEPTNGASREADAATPVRLEWAGVGMVAGRKRRVVLSEAAGVAKAGRTLALLGPSGAGKTTLLRCLAGRAAPDAGSVRLVVSGGSTRAARAGAVRPWPGRDT